MNDAVAMTAFERDLANRLQAHLGPRHPVDARSIASVAMASARPAITIGRRWRLGGGLSGPFSSRSLVWAGLAASLLLTALALALLSGRQPTLPVPSASPSAGPSASAAPTSQSYVAMFMRSDGNDGADLFEALPDGGERLIRRFAPFSSEEADTDLRFGHAVISPFGIVSETGWLAVDVQNVPGGDAYAFYDLQDLTHKPWVLSYWGAVGGAWSPDGLFAMPLSFGDRNGIRVVDPDAHTFTDLRSAFAVGSGPTVYWAADGSGVISNISGGDPQTYGVYPIDNGPAIPGLVRAADRRGRRVTGVDGVAFCGQFSPFYGPPRCAESNFAVANDSGTVTQLPLDVLPGFTTVDASFASDGKAFWTLQTNPDSSQPLQLVKLDSPNTSHVVAVIDRSAMPEPSIDPQVSFAGLAPDDSLVVVYQTVADRVKGIYIATDGSAARNHDGILAGFAPTAVADSWPSQSDVPSPPSPTPFRTPWPTIAALLPSVIPLQGPFVPVLLRDQGTGIDVVVIEPDGSERQIRRVSTADEGLADLQVPDGNTLGMGSYGFVSSDGWVAVPAFTSGGPPDVPPLDYYAFYDLTDPSGTAWVLRHTGFTSGVWGPNGLFAINTASIVDPRTRTHSTLGGSAALGGGPTMFWAADGSGLLGFRDSILGTYKVFGPTFVPGLPSIADKIGPRAFGADGWAICHPDSWSLFFGEQIQECLDAAVATADLDDNVVVWADQTLLDGDVSSASYSADWSAIWAVVTDPTSTMVSVVWLEAPSLASVTASIDGSLLLDSRQPAYIGGLAPDDSIIVLRQSLENRSGMVVVPMDGTEPSSHAGEFAGFVPSLLADEWPTIP